MTNQLQTTGSCEKIVGEMKNLPANMEENKNSDQHRTHRATNILCVRRKKQLKMLRNKLFVHRSKTCTNYMNIVFANWYTKDMFTSVYAAYYTVSVRNKIFGKARMVPDEIKEVRLSSIVTPDKGAGMLTCPLQ